MSLIDIEAEVDIDVSAKRGVLETITFYFERINNLIMIFASIAILAAALVLTMSVLTRYFFKVPTDWQDEAAVFLIVGSVFMCGAFVQSYRGHIGIEALASILPPKVNRVRRLLVDFASFGYCAFFSWKSWALLHEAVAEHQTTSSSFAPPLWIPYGLMAVGMTLLSFQIFFQIWKHFTSQGETR